MSAVNADILELFKMGQASLLELDCDSADGFKDQIVDLMTVPLLQGALRCVVPFSITYVCLLVACSFAA